MQRAVVIKEPHWRTGGAGHGSSKSRHNRGRSISLTFLVIGAWGFAIVIASMLFLYVGHLIDEMLHTPPTFMLGLFFLGLALCIGRLYKDAWDRIERRPKVKG